MKSKNIVFVCVRMCGVHTVTPVQASCGCHLDIKGYYVPLTTAGCNASDVRSGVPAPHQVTRIFAVRCLVELVRVPRQLALYRTLPHRSPPAWAYSDS